MTQANWATTTAGDYTFFADADAAVISYLQASAPNDLSTYLADFTFRRSVLKQPMHDESVTSFPLIYVWTELADTQFHAAPSVPVQVRTRFTVWSYDVDVDAMAQQVQGICGAIASAIQQSRDTTGNDWADWYTNWDLPTATIGSIEFLEAGEDVLFCRGTVVATWTHDE